MKQPAAAAAQHNVISFPLQPSLCGLYWHHCLPNSSSSSSASLPASFCPFWAKLPFPMRSSSCCFWAASLFVAQLQFFFSFRFFRIVDDVCMIMGRSSGLNFWAHNQLAGTNQYPVFMLDKINKLYHNM